MEQGFQGWEYKFNSVSSSRGDYPFITVTAGTRTSIYGKLATIKMLEVRKNGQGKEGHKKPVLFPKIVFCTMRICMDRENRWKMCLKQGLNATRKTMYPDWLSLTGDGYVPSIYKNTARSSARWDVVHFFLHGMRGAA